MSAGPATATPLRISTNTKYLSRNPLIRALIRRFFRAVEAFAARAPGPRVLEVGCGEGVLLHHLRDVLGARCVAGVDTDARELACARDNVPSARVLRGDASRLPFGDATFDLVLCCEVLEHVGDPARALDEIARVTRGACVLSVPREPLWRAMNLARGAYAWDLGNTPGHVNHWGARAFRRFVSRQLDVVEVATPAPWVVLLARSRSRSHATT